MTNGEEVTIRPVRADDGPLLVRFHETLSDRSVYLRYLTARKLSTRVAGELLRLCFVDSALEVTLVVEREREIIAVGRLHEDLRAFAQGRRQAEFALVVSDNFQRQGLGTELVRRLIEVARHKELDQVFGEISAENIIMQKICRSMGFQLGQEFGYTTVIARLKLE